jgi:hypothetical protein
MCLDTGHVLNLWWVPHYCALFAKLFHIYTYKNTFETLDAVDQKDKLHKI